MNATLVIMAAGLGSRFHGGIKQLEPVGPNGELIIDYSIYDAKEAGFNKVVFIIRKSIEDDFKKIIGNRISKIIEVEYAYQELDYLISNEDISNRVKPWGTVHAILCAKEYVNEPFLVINADDYYGKESYKKAYEFLINTSTDNYCMIGFLLKNTMSNNGGVNRGICKIDSDFYLKEVVETKNIKACNDKVIGEVNKKEVLLNLDDYVSMNMWGFMPNIFERLEKYWSKFLQDMDKDDITSECLLPMFVDSIIKSNDVTVRVLKTDDVWFGITYQEDKYKVKEAFEDMIKKGLYKYNLYD